MGLFGGLFSPILPLSSRTGSFEYRIQSTVGRLCRFSLLCGNSLQTWSSTFVFDDLYARLDSFRCSIGYMNLQSVTYVVGPVGPFIWALEIIGASQGWNPDGYVEEFQGTRTVRLEKPKVMTFFGQNSMANSGK